MSRPTLSFRLARLLAPALLLAAGACAGEEPGGVRLTLSGSALGAEGEVLKRQVARFEAANPGIDVQIQQTPDDATQRHQLYVQWLNARAGDPDILQLDVVWTPEFAAAGWVLPLDRFGPPREEFFPATVEANTWQGTLFALPWFVDVGMLYYRTDLMPRPPRSLDELVRFAQEATPRPRLGHVWQGARYEGLVTGFVEILGAFGGRIMTPDGRVVVDSPEAVRALTWMRDLLYRYDVSPRQVLTWHEEEARFAFQNGEAAFMRNWPYAYALLSDSSQSEVAGRFAVAPMPAAPGGEPTAALGGAQLAVNAHSEHPEEAYRLIRFLTEPEQMLERAEVVGQFPTRPVLYDDPRLAEALAIPVERAREIVSRARPRPVTPIWTQLSEILQVQLHRALVRQAEPEAALRSAAREMNEIIEKTGVRELYRRPAS
jgi:multiple sugar transport system substrate-binding protein